eukprot:TRINITY_DN24609_c0_g1_i1.p1 TRINITY_DN24609_c0_g1~~TRINITY_DN24609_c0_g1_i1.p1  ORF type:complete len:266 (+),score=43.76 TRINITY_DN24609_c0_g1_i1:72-869(+)
MSRGTTNREQKRALLQAQALEAWGAAPKAAEVAEVDAPSGRKWQGDTWTMSDKSWSSANRDSWATQGWSDWQPSNWHSTAADWSQDKSWSHVGTSSTQEPVMMTEAEARAMFAALIGAWIDADRSRYEVCWSEPEQSLSVRTTRRGGKVIVSRKTIRLDLLRDGARVSWGSKPSYVLAPGKAPVDEVSWFSPSKKLRAFAWRRDHTASREEEPVAPTWATPSTANDDYDVDDEAELEKVLIQAEAAEEAWPSWEEVVRQMETLKI